jgi:hypothetical protein
METDYILCDVGIIFYIIEIDFRLNGCAVTGGWFPAFHCGD